MLRLDASADRAALTTLVWGADAAGAVDALAAAAAHRRARVNLLGATGLIALAGAALLGPLTGNGTLMLLLGLGGLAATTPWLFRGRVPSDRRLTAGRAQHRPSGRRPVGATTAGRAAGRSLFRGTITDGHSWPAPLTERPCVAFSVVLSDSTSTGSITVLTDSATAGFRVRCADGIIEVPPGPIDLMPEGNRCDLFEARLHLSSLDPAGESDESPDPFPHDTVREAILAVGDRVELRAEVSIIPNTGAEPTGYRTQADSIRRTIGIVQIVSATRRESD